MVNPSVDNSVKNTIPYGWESCTWDSVAEGFTSGATPYRAIPQYFNGTINWVSSGELNYNVIFDTNEHISEDAQKCTNLTLHPVNTFLMAITGLEAAGTRGSCAILGKPATTNQSCMAIYGTEKLDIRFLFYYYTFMGDELAFKYCQGTKQQSYTAQIVKKLPILLPPIEEQIAIAEELTDIDTLIFSLDRILSKKKAIKQGAMQELLTGKRRLPGFSGEWKEYTLAELGDFSKGSGISRAEADSGRICAVRYGELYTRHINYVKRYYSHISEEAANKAQRIYFGDILFAASGETKEEIGKCASIIDDNEVFAGGDIVVFHPRSPIHPIFLGCLLNTPKVQKQKSEKAQGDAIVHIHADSLQKIIISIPTYEEQSAIGEILKNMDDEIDELELKLSKYRRMKQGMMQQLLTGIIRLV